MEITAYISPPQSGGLNNQQPIKLITDNIGVSANLWKELSFDEQSLLICSYLDEIGYMGWAVNRIIN